METKKSTSAKVLMFPWLAHGHISPYLELAKKLAKKNFHIFFCSTAINLSSIKKSFQNDFSELFSIEFIELHLPYIPELPPHYHTTKVLPPNLASTLMNAFQMSKTSFKDIFMSLKPNLLIYDIFQPWAAELASLYKVPSVCFFTSGAASTSYFYHIFRYGSSESSLSSYPFQDIFLRDHEKKRLPDVPDPVFLMVYNSLELSHEIVLIKSCRGIEGKYLDHLSSLSGKKMVPLCPLVQELSHIQVDHLHIFDWLNSKNSSSVVLVSFGSEYFPSKEEIEEIAHGLELSKVNFIWVIRFPEGSTMIVEELVPEGFLERTKDTGIIIKGWAPQAKILQHPSIGGFVTHCGWGSTIETLYYGVPVIAIPMCVEQPINARLLVALGAGKEVLKDENEKLVREEIAKVIKEIVVKKTGEDVKFKNVRELSQKLRIEEEELVDEAIANLQSICFNNKPKELATSKG